MESSLILKKLKPNVTLNLQQSLHNNS